LLLIIVRSLTDSPNQIPILVQKKKPKEVSMDVESGRNPEGGGNPEKREAGGSSKSYYPMKYIVLFKPKGKDPEADVLAIVNIIKARSLRKAWIICDGEKPKKNRQGWFQAAATDDFGLGYLIGEFSESGFEVFGDPVDPDNWRELR
jgi:hypothetical protein